MRHIILHNHLFKNAGTSVDHILRENFQDRWIAGEFQSDADANTAEVRNWIHANPNAIAFSSHTIRGPLPKISGVNIIPIVLLRDPVDRIASAYRFERQQKAETFGTQLARAHGFAGYVHARLSSAGDRQCRNFQTQRLAALAPVHSGSELARARNAAIVISHSGLLGLVSEFGGAMARLREILVPHFPDFTWQPITANSSTSKSGSAVSPDMRKMLAETNQDDIALICHARSVIGQASTGASTAQDAGMVYPSA